MALQLRRGSTGERLAGFVPAVGEPIYDTTSGAMYVGDGVTPGGKSAGSSARLGEIGDVSIAENDSIALANISSQDGVLTITTAEPHGLVAGNSFLFVSTSNPALTGYLTASAILDTSTIETAGPVSNIAIVSDGGYVKKTGYLLGNGGYLYYNSSTGTWNAYDPPVLNGSALVYDTGLGVWQARQFRLAQLDDVDVTTQPPSIGWTIAWNGSQWVSENGTARNAFGRGDAGDFTNTSKQGFVFGVYGGGNFTAGTTDQPIELTSGAVDGGSF